MNPQLSIEIVSNGMIITDNSANTGMPMGGVPGLNRSVYSISDGMAQLEQMVTAKHADIKAKAQAKA
jgi:hypothetical protein